MTSPEQTVNAFLAKWAEPGGFVRSIDEDFTDTTVYENVGLSKTTGKAEARAFAEQFSSGDPGSSLRVKTLHSVANGKIVMNERIDDILAGDGTVRMSIRVVGIFEVVDGKIANWRDYFDTAGFFKTMSEAAPA